MNANMIEKFSPHLFWDVDKSQLDAEKHTTYIIRGVLEYGFYKDWLLIVKYYGLDKIIQLSLPLRNLDPKTISFLAAKGKIKKDKFVCYNTRPSLPKHWNF